LQTEAKRQASRTYCRHKRKEKLSGSTAVRRGNLAHRKYCKQKDKLAGSTTDRREETSWPEDCKQKENGPTSWTFFR
jgi:hypothetical protein